MVHLRVSEVWLLCRPSCCLKESHLSDKYCHYAVIYPFTIMASSLISSFMDLLTKEIALCCARSWQSDKIPLFTFSLVVSHLVSLYQSLAHILHELLDESSIKKHMSFHDLYFFPFSRKWTVLGMDISNPILPKTLLDGTGNKTMPTQSEMYTTLSVPTGFLQ